MSDIKHREHLEHEISPIDKWKHFQDNYGRKAGIGLALVLILILGYFGYKQYILDPKEKQAQKLCSGLKNISAQILCVLP